MSKEFRATIFLSPQEKEFFDKIIAEEQKNFLVLKKLIQLAMEATQNNTGS